MSDHVLSVSLTNREIITDPYWLHMEIVEDQPDDGMTVGQAAAIIDSIYGIETCGESPALMDVWNLQGERDPAPEEPPPEDKFASAISALSLPSCTNIAATAAGEPGSYDVQIQVFRSHQDELYKLRLSNGTSGSPRRTRERVVHTIDVDGKTHITLDNPVIGRPVIVWQGFSGPEINIMGNTLWWDGEVTGTLRAEFDTIYDLLDIHVHGEPTDSEVVVGTMPPGFMGVGWYSGTEDAGEITDLQNIECSVLAFYHYQYQELILNRPEDDETVSDDDRFGICNGLVTIGDGDRDGEAGEETTCYQLREVIEICDCSKEEQSRSERVAVACPEGVAAGSTLEDAAPTVEYVSCGEHDKVYDPAFYKETCCEEWPFYPDQDMPRCTKIYKKFGGRGDVDESAKADLQEKYDNISFVSVGPESNICGEWVIEQLINANNCCDGVPPISWDEENSAEVIDGTGEVFILGSTAETVKEWKVRGDGFYVDAGLSKRDISTKNDSIVIYQKPDACGTATIYVTDGCSSATGFVRSPNGSWQSVPLDQVEDRDVTADSYVSLVRSPTYCSARSSVRLQAYNGKYLYQQTYLWTHESGPIDVDNSSCTCESYVPSSWDALRDDVAARHDMPSGEIQLINPFSGARLLPPSNEKVFHQNGLQVVPDESDSTGRGVTRYCYQYRDPASRLRWACMTAGGTVHARGDDMYCPSTNPQAWTWVC